MNCLKLLNLWNLNSFYILYLNVIILYYYYYRNKTAILNSGIVTSTEKAKKP